ncbi:MAG: retron Eco8 family effector endonuclease, partial [Alphaproteobacteria bacterium]|nr:retron Eco8 family effector endonuclease [Alphaproteobacteria bacterium]
MPLVRVKIENFKSINCCDLSMSDLNILIGENGTGKTNILDAINYFYTNLTSANKDEHIFDQNNRFSNEVKISLFFDFSEFVKISKSNFGEVNPLNEHLISDVKYAGYYKAILSMASKSKDNVLSIVLRQVKGRHIRWNYSYEDRFIFKSLFPFFYIDTRNIDVTQWSLIWDVLGDLGKVSNNERKNIEGKFREILLDNNKEISKKIKSIESIFTAADLSIKPATAKEFAINLSKITFSGNNLQKGEKDFAYYSSGTNSVKYIELLLRSIDEIAKTKLKEPVVLIDEPEISLHPLYIDELSETLSGVTTKLKIIISTHSSRLTKNLITLSENVLMYNIKLID